MSQIKLAYEDLMQLQDEASWLARAADNARKAYKRSKSKKNHEAFIKAAGDHCAAIYLCEEQYAKIAKLEAEIALEDEMARRFAEAYASPTFI